MPGIPAPIMSVYLPEDSEVSISVPVLLDEEAAAQKVKGLGSPSVAVGRKGLITGGSSLVLCF